MRGLWSCERARPTAISILAVNCIKSSTAGAGACKEADSEIKTHQPSRLTPLPRLRNYLHRRGFLIANKPQKEHLPWCESGFKVYSYRWAVLAAFMLVIAINQLSWITFAPITTQAMTFYGVSDLEIGLLSLSFMAVYVVVSFPASWVIDTYGIRVGVGIGAALTGLFGLLRGFTASTYAGILVAQIGIAIGQPFILNAITTVAGRWFPQKERATASGLGSLSIYLGILLGLALTPYLVLRSGIPGMLTMYGAGGLVAMLVFFIVARDRPPSPPCPPEQDVRSLVLEGLAKMLRQRSFILLLAVFFVGLGVFNAATTWIEQILSPRGFSATQAGDAGGLMILGGILGRRASAHALGSCSPAGTVSCPGGGGRHGRFGRCNAGSQLHVTLGQFSLFLDSSC